MKVPKMIESDQNGQEKYKSNLNNQDQKWLKQVKICSKLTNNDRKHLQPNKPIIGKLVFVFKEWVQLPFSFFGGRGASTFFFFHSAASLSSILPFFFSFSRFLLSAEYPTAFASLTRNNESGCATGISSASKFTIHHKSFNGRSEL